MTATAEPQAGTDEARTAYAILAALCACHLLNDTIQSLLPAIYPVLRENYALTFTQIGVIQFAAQATASLLQPLVGAYTDKRPSFRLPPLGMAASLAGLILLASAHAYEMLVLAAMLVGVGSSIFHPEASRNARDASGGRYGFAQSVFQVGGNAGTALGPLLAAFIVLPFGQGSITWFAGLALIGMALLWHVGTWAKARHLAARARRAAPRVSALSPGRVRWIVGLLLLLIFSKHVYIASMASYYTFFLIDRFGTGVREAQLLLFLFLGALAVGTYVGGPIGDRIGRKRVISVSILGVLPFTLMLPYAPLWGVALLTVIIGLLLASAFPAIVVYAQALLPGRVGMVSGLFFGFAFGVAAIGAAMIGALADRIGIGAVFQLTALLPAIGLLTLLLPDETRLTRPANPA
ncbi:MFS transporter [Amaricoccus solimangrovi]|uniref:MFS transporter n=1 Tax=Amaricoccus solimangrovi TaxID=2589815 RepID=A0A501WM11_9RHOB|nr:MFS transporter [Amaricoccus solimangrovi]TPE49395.1 MFS transporter [Amaricoccus solimangrovi]